MDKVLGLHGKEERVKDLMLCDCPEVVLGKLLQPVISAVFFEDSPPQTECKVLGSLLRLRLLIATQSMQCAPLPSKEPPGGEQTLKSLSMCSDFVFKRLVLKDLEAFVDQMSRERSLYQLLLNSILYSIR